MWISFGSVHEVRRIFKPLEDLKLSVINWAEKKNIEVKGYGEVYILAWAFQNLLDSLGLN